VNALLMAAAGAFVVTMGFTPLLMRWLRAHGIGQQIRDDGPIEHPHVAKAGTPTMGGIAIVTATVFGYLFAHVRRESIRFSTSGWALIALIFGLGVVGWIDDYLGVRAHRNLGLRKRGKTLGIVAVAGLFAWLAIDFAHTSTHLSFTRPLSTNLGSVGMFLFAIVLVYATANAVNLTDGADGLATGSSALTFAAFMIIAFTEFRHPALYYQLPALRAQTAQALDQAIVAAAMFGSCAGFLWWNGAPAQIIMGDTGSLAIGGALGTTAILLKSEFLLLLVGGVFVAETTSVVLQTGIFKWRMRRHGRPYAEQHRLFRMAPLHHHFEQMGWHESTVVTRFYILGIICALVALATLKIR